MRKIIFFCFFLLNKSLAQTNKYESYLKNEKQYLNKLLSEKDFLFKADSILKVNFDKKGTTTTDSLIVLLQKFKEVAWSSDEYKKYRTRYYKYLTVNSQFSGRGGEAFFYSGKYGQELRSINKKDAYEIVTKLHYLTRNENFEEVIKTYLDNKKYLQAIWAKSQTAEFSEDDADQALKILSNVSNVYINLQKFDKAKEILVLAKNLQTEISSNSYLSQKAKLVSLLTLNYLDFYINLYEGKTEKAQIILEECSQIVNQFEDILGSNALYHIDRINTHKQQYYFVLNDPDKILKALNEKKTERYRGHYESMIDAETRGRVAAMQNDFKNGYNYLFQALVLQKKEYKTISKEMNELLYSHAEAEYNRAEVLKAEKYKKKVFIWIIIIGLIFLLLLVLIIYLLNREKYRLNELHRITQIQINEAIQRTSLEEKRKLGQDLHDGMSGTLAMILYKIIDIKNKSSEENIKIELDILHARFHDLYGDIRNKSHLNFYAPLEIENDFLEESIKKLANSALKGTITKDISIDKHACVLFDINTRIEILKILQEAFSNIIKHAKKVSEMYIYLYKNQNNIILEIGNNGVSNRFLDTEGGIGIKSIRARVDTLGGQVIFTKSTSEFVLEIVLPINHK